MVDSEKPGGSERSAELALRPTDRSERRSTRQVLVAPSDARRDWGIEWYEFDLIPELGSLTGLAVGADGEAVSYLRLQLRDGTDLRAVFVHGDTRIDEEIHLGRDSSGEVRIEGTINGQAFEIGERDQRERGVAGGELRFTAAERKAFSQWSGISEQLSRLSSAVDGGDAERRSCTGCALEGAGISIGAGCCVFNPGCCVAALTAAGDFIDNCVGACA